MSPRCAVAVLTMMAAEPEPPRPRVDGDSDGDCPRCRKKKMPPTARMITNATTTHTQWRRCLPDAGCQGTFGVLSELAGSGVESDIFRSIGFRQSKNVETCCAIHHVMLSDFETTSIGFIFPCRWRCGIPRGSRLLAVEEVFDAPVCANWRCRTSTGK